MTNLFESDNTNVEDLISVLWFFGEQCKMAVIKKRNITFCTRIS